MTQLNLLRIIGTYKGQLGRRGQCRNILNMVTCPLVAIKVVTIGNKSGRTYLTKDDDGVWTGDVDAGEAGNEIRLSAAFEEESNTYSTLLSYTVSHTFRH